MPWAFAVIRDKTAIVGLGATPYYKRGTSTPQTLEELVGKSILAAVHDAGLKVREIDGFAYFAGGFDTALLTETLGIPEIRFSATLTGTGGGSAGAMRRLRRCAETLVATEADRPRRVFGDGIIWCFHTVREAME